MLQLSILKEIKEFLRCERKTDNRENREIREGEGEGVSNQGIISKDDRVLSTQLS